MAERSISVRLRANVDDYRKKMRQASSATDAAASSIDRDGKKINTAAGRMVRSAEVNREAWDTSGQALTAFGVAGVAALGVSAKAAIDWESAWTGVLKTVDGTPEQLAALEEGIRDMALRLPASTTEIAAVAEAAGQLGVNIGDVEAFTETMINLGETTNLTADQAATSIARIANIMGTAVTDVDRMGATIVDLGNNSATTEAEIVALSTRMAAAGSQAGLSESDVLAFSSALTSVGVEAEAGGTAMSKVFTSIGDAARDGGGKLTAFADVAGVSVEEFRQAFEEDAAGAIGMFVEGMGRMSAEGESTTAVFDELELTDQRLKRSILSLGSAEGLLGEQLDIASAAWESNTALVEEAEKRYDTTDAKLKIAKNSLNEAAIVIGENLLPMLADLAGGVAGVAQAFADLPDWVQKSITGIGGVAAVASLAAGGFLLLLPRIIETRRAFQTIRGSVGRFGTTMRGLTRGGGALAAATLGFAALTTAVEALPSAGRKSTSSVSELTSALLDMEAAGGDLEGAFGFTEDLFGWTGGIDDITDAAGRLTNPSLMDRMQDVGGSIRGIFGSGDTGRTLAIDEIDAIGQSLASLVQSGEAESAERQFEMLAAQWEAGGGSIEELKELMPAYTDAQKDAENQTRLTAEASDVLIASQEELATEAEAAQQAVDSWRETASTANAAFIDIGGAYDSAIQKNIDLATSTADGTEAADDSWEDFYDGVSVSAGEYIAQLQEQVDAQSAWEENMVAIAERANLGMTGEMAKAANAMIDELLTLGPEGAAQVQLLKDMTDEEFAEVVSLWSERGTDAVSEFTDQVEQYRQPEIDVSADMSSAYGRVADYLTYVTGVRTRIGMGAGGGGGLTYAAGGEIRGPGTSTSDSIPLWASDGEFMHKAAAHQFWGTPTMHAINNNDVAGVWRALSTKRLAGGGEVSRSFAPAPSVNVSHSLGDVVARMDSADVDRLADALHARAEAGTSRALTGTRSMTDLIERMG